MKDSQTIVHELRTRGVPLRAIVRPIHLTAMRRLPRQEKFGLGRAQSPGDPASSITCLAKQRHSRHANSF